MILKSVSTVILMGVLFIGPVSLFGNEARADQESQIERVNEGNHKMKSVIFENQYSSVTKVSLAPGESLPAHDGENRVIYSLSDYSINWQEQGKDYGVRTAKRGGAHFHETGEHAVKNIGETKAEWLVFSSKGAGLPGCEESLTETDHAPESANFTETLFDNDHFLVTRVTLPAGSTLPSHAGLNRVIYSLSDYSIGYESDSQAQITKQFKKGDVHWHEACIHSVKNNGDTDAVYLVVGYKQ